MTQPLPARAQVLVSHACKESRSPSLRRVRAVFAAARGAPRRGLALVVEERQGLNRQSVPREQCYLSFVRCKDKFS